MFQTGCQRTPVDSIATWVTASLVSQAASACRSAVIVPKVRDVFVTLPVDPIWRQHATTNFACTSIPQQCACKTSIAVLLVDGARGPQVVGILLRVLEATVSGTQGGPGQTSLRAFAPT
jgi:hypothetical protein